MEISYFGGASRRVTDVLRRDIAAAIGCSGTEFCAVVDGVVVADGGSECGVDIALAAWMDEHGIEAVSATIIEVDRKLVAGGIVVVVGGETSFIVRGQEDREWRLERAHLEQLYGD